MRVNSFNPAYEGAYQSLSFLKDNESLFCSKPLLNNKDLNENSGMTSLRVVQNKNFSNSVDFSTDMNPTFIAPKTTTDHLSKSIDVCTTTTNNAKMTISYSPKASLD